MAKKGEKPLDGKTDTDPEGLSAVNAGGKWAREAPWRSLCMSLIVMVLFDHALFDFKFCFVFLRGLFSGYIITFVVVL